MTADWKPVELLTDSGVVIVPNKNLVKVLTILDESLAMGYHLRIHNGVLEMTEDNIEQEFVHNLLTINITDKY